MDARERGEQGMQGVMCKRLCEAYVDLFRLQSNPKPGVDIEYSYS
jgi:hypothetical protein